MKSEKPPIIEDDDIAVFKLRMDFFEKMLHEIKQAVEQGRIEIQHLKQPRPTNWIALMTVFLAFCGVTLSTVAAVCSGGWLWLNVRLSPLEMKLAATEQAIAASRAESSQAVAAARAEASRELTWFNSETQSRYNNLKDNVNRLYSRVFGVAEQPTSPSTTK